MGSITIRAFGWVFVIALEKEVDEEYELEKLGVLKEEIR